MGRGLGTELGGIQRLPQATVAQDKEDGFHTEAVIGPGTTTAEAMGVHMFGEEHLHGVPQVIGYPPLVGNLQRVHDVNLRTPTAAAENKCSCTQKL
jgi:hypothetical protein